MPKSGDMDDMGFMYKTMIERDPKKRRVKPVGPGQQSLLDFDLEESSDDSDFRIEDHPEESDDEDDSLDSDAQDQDEDEDDVSDNSVEVVADMGRPRPTEELSVTQLLDFAKLRQTKAKQKQFDTPEIKIVICCGCLGDRSDDANEIVECDGCGVTVHEGCYGVSDSASVSSTISSCSTEPWFCEACRAGVTSPVCELCPNSGGIFKETDVGKWVHLVCALYVPGVAFGEVDKLSSVTLFEMPYSKWGSKTCCLCEDTKFARTGVCIGCDAGMCRTYFHVTCAQREGLLSEAHSEEVDQADPFYAHCKMHSDKTLIRKRKRNWLALQLRTKIRQDEQERNRLENVSEQRRIQRKLLKYRSKYLSNKSSRIPPWVPTQKMPRLLTSSASACRKLMRKADLMGIDSQALEIQEAQMAALADVRKKWHIQPAFSVEFIGYYLDRNVRLMSMKRKLKELLDVSSQLQDEQHMWRQKYDQLLKENSDLSIKNTDLKKLIHKYHGVILHVCPNKDLPNIDELGKSPPPRPASIGHRSSSSFSSPRQESSGRHRESGPLPLNECGICCQTKDQHLLAKCDTCHLYYHLGCLNPPLTRMPKKTKLMGWQCSECDKESSGSEVECVDTEAPRKLRHKDSDKMHMQSPPQLHLPPPPPVVYQPEVVMPKLTIKPIIPNPAMLSPPIKTFLTAIPGSSAGEEQYQVSQRSGKKRRREKHHRYSPEIEGMMYMKEHKRKRKRKSQDLESPQQETPRIKIKIKSIPMPGGEGASTSGQQMFVATSTTETMVWPSMSISTSPSVSISQPVVSLSRSSTGSIKRGSNKDGDDMTKCDVCDGPGTNQNLVRCDDCMRCFHFTCLDPPVKKSPKRRGYSWHCADCDPTETESDN